MTSTEKHAPTAILQNGQRTEVHNLPDRSQAASRKTSEEAINEIRDFFPSSALEYLSDNFLKEFSENWQQTLVSVCLDTIFEVINF